MTIAIMQPYFLPYIGYFQLMKAVDAFVFYDDVTYIKQGWINRNRILLNGKDYLFTLELKGSSSYKYINSIEVGNNRNKLLKTFVQAYRNAPYFSNIEPILYSIFRSSQSVLSEYIYRTHELIITYLGLSTELKLSSEIYKNKLFKGQDKILEICNKLGADSYINSSGGKNLYSRTDFGTAKVKLSFLTPNKIEYNQFDNDFIPWLSIIDVMMFNSVDTIQAMLDQHELE